MLEGWESERALAHLGIRTRTDPTDNAHMANSPAGEGTGHVPKGEGSALVRSRWTRGPTAPNNARIPGPYEARQAPRSTK